MSDEQEQDLYDFLRDCADPDREAIAIRTVRKLFERLGRPDLATLLRELP